jgi:hypothetical protein
MFLTILLFLVTPFLCSSTVATNEATKRNPRETGFNIRANLSEESRSKNPSKILYNTISEARGNLRTARGSLNEVDQRIAYWLKRPAKDGNLQEIFDYYEQNRKIFNISHLADLETILYNESVPANTNPNAIYFEVLACIYKKPETDQNDYYMHLTMLLSLLYNLSYSSEDYNSVIGLIQVLDDMEIWRDVHGKPILLIQDSIGVYLSTYSKIKGPEIDRKVFTREYYRDLHNNTKDPIYKIIARSFFAIENYISLVQGVLSLGKNEVLKGATLNSKPGKTPAIARKLVVDWRRHGRIHEVFTPLEILKNQIHDWQGQLKVPVDEICEYFSKYSSQLDEEVYSGLSGLMVKNTGMIFADLPQVSAFMLSKVIGLVEPEKPREYKSRQVADLFGSLYVMVTTIGEAKRNACELLLALYKMEIWKKAQGHLFEHLFHWLVRKVSPLGFSAAKYFFMDSNVQGDQVMKNIATAYFLVSMQTDEESP